MKNRYFIFIIFILLVLSSYSTAYQIERKNITQDVDKMTEKDYNDYLKKALRKRNTIL